MEYTKLPSPPPKMPPSTVVMNLTRVTEQVLMVIIYNHKENTYNKFKNVLTLNRPIAKAYGSGKTVGISKTVKTVEGHWTHCYRIGMVTFDNVYDAKRFIDSKLPNYEAREFGGVEMFLLPCSVPLMPIMDYKYTSMEVFDVRNGEVFSKYLCQAQKFATDFGGTAVSGSSQVGRWEGGRRPSFVYIIQWPGVENFETYDAKVRQLIPGAGASCLYRVIFELASIKALDCC